MLKNLTIDVDKKDEKGRSALHLAVKSNDLTRVKKLISQGANINSKDNKNRTPLHKAAYKYKEECYFKVAEFLLKKGADVNVQDNKGMTPFWYLVRKSNLKMVQLFLNFKADFRVPCKEGRTPLYPAVRWNNKNLEIVQLLIDLGLDVNSRDKSGITPLNHAAEKGDSHLNVVELLINNGADVNEYFEDSEFSLFQILVTEGSLEMIKLFVNFGANIYVDYGGQTLLSRAALHNRNVDVLQLFIDLGLNVNSVNDKGETPLHFACRSEGNYVEKIKCLLKNRADINAADKNGCTPLFDALRNTTPLNITSEKVEKTLNFIMDLTDFSDDYSKNILTFNENLSEYSWMIILKHVAKLQSRNVPVNPDLLDAILENDEYNDYYKQCEEELIRAKNTKLKNSWITFYNLLVDDKKKLKNYASNEVLIENLYSNNCNKVFPIYGATMDENIKKGFMRRELFDRSAIKLSNRLPIFNSTHLILRDILDCVLSKKNLSKLCE